MVTCLQRLFKRPQLALMGESRLGEMALSSCSSGEKTRSSPGHPVCEHTCVHTQAPPRLPCGNSARPSPAVSRAFAKSQGESAVALSSALSLKALL